MGLIRGSVGGKWNSCSFSCQVDEHGISGSILGKHQSGCIILFVTPEQVIGALGVPCQNSYLDVRIQRNSTTLQGSAGTSSLALSQKDNHFEGIQGEKLRLPTVLSLQGYTMTGKVGQGIFSTKLELEFSNADPLLAALVGCLAEIWYTSYNGS